MKPKNDKYYVVPASLVYFAIALIIAAAFASAVLGRNLAPVDTVTYGSVTMTETQTVASISWGTVTSISYLVHTEVNYTTVGALLPSFVFLSGNAASKGIGTSATNVVFRATDNSTSQTAAISDGKYSLNLKNQEYYNVFVQYAGILQGIGSGECPAGALVLVSNSDSLQADWAC